MHIRFQKDDLENFISDKLKDELKEIVSDLLTQGFKSLQTTNSEPSSGKVYNLGEAAAKLNLSPHTVKKYARSGQLRRAMPNIKGFRFTGKELERFLGEYRTNP
jgi:hypothetical protein